MSRSKQRKETWPNTILTFNNTISMKHLIVASLCGCYLSKQNRYSHRNEEKNTQTTYALSILFAATTFISSQFSFVFSKSTSKGKSSMFSILLPKHSASQHSNAIKSFFLFSSICYLFSFLFFSNSLSSFFRFVIFL